MAQPVSTLYTQTLIQRSEYDSKEHSAGSNDLWLSAQKFSPDNLNHVVKVEQTLKQAGKNLKYGSIFNPKNHEVSLIALRKKILETEEKEIWDSYQTTIDLLKKEIINITKKVKKVIENPSALEEKQASFLEKIKELSVSLLNLYDRIQKEKEALKESVLASDPRCFKKNIKPFDKLGMYHSNYRKAVEKWKLEGKITSNASEIECWQWKGKKKGLKYIKCKTNYLANTLHTAEKCLVALQENIKNEKFKDRQNYSGPTEEERHPLFSIPTFAARFQGLGQSDSMSMGLLELALLKSLIQDRP